MSQLFVPLPVTRFSFKQRDEFISTLDRVETNSSLRSISSSSDLELDINGRSREGLRYSSQAFRRLCDTTQPGLYTLVDSLSDSAALFPLAVSIFNQLVSAQFDRKLRDCHLLIDRCDGRIDAVLPNSSIFMSNLASIQQLDSLIDRDYKHYEGIIHGRRVVARRYVSSPLFAVGDMRVHRGIHVYHNEGVQGQFRAAWTLVLSHGPVTLVDPLNVKRRVRQSVRSADRIKEWLERVCVEDIPAESLREYLNTAADASLRLSGDDSDIGRARWIRKQLQAVGLSSSVAKRAVAEAVAPTTSGSTPALGLTKEELASRTVLDLILAACRCGKRQGAELAERVDTGAMRLLHRVSKF